LYGAPSKVRELLKKMAAPDAKFLTVRLVRMQETFRIADFVALPDLHPITRATKQME
jgi:hypothetical protein